jgi:cyclopropane fatty-acyl-phospholipid synthase-like methyltransferase
MNKMNPILDKEYIAEYYDQTLPYYAKFWSRDSESNALHYGFWEKDTKNIKEALLSENRFLSEIAGIKSTDKVLDAGCGIGGSALWIAKNVGATVTGVTLSKRQLEEAKELAIKNNLEERVDFHIGDYLHADFADNSFDIVWAIESVCHAERKIEFLREAYRLLRKGGRLVVADGFLLRKPLDSEGGLYNKFLVGLALPNLAGVADFQEDMKEVGFVSPQFFDKTDAVKKSARMLYERCLVAYPFAKIANALGLIPDIVFRNGPAGIAQYKMVKSGLAGYGIFLGKK